jgi:hypothetical protein
VAKKSVHQCQDLGCTNFASVKYSGYCKEHYAEQKREYLIKEGYYGYGFHQGEFFSDKFGIVKDKFGYEET